MFSRNQIPMAAVTVSCLFQISVSAMVSFTEPRVQIGIRNILGKIRRTPDNKLVGVDQAVITSGPPTKTRRRKRFADLRIRKSTLNDIDQISTLLAQASFPNDEKDVAWNWNKAMSQLKAKGELQTQLSHRLRAVEEGHRSITTDNDLAENSMTYYHDKLWTNEKFRSKLETAVKATKEKTVWGNLNFSVIPEDPRLLQHVMISAYDECTGDIIGFCEVAMIPVPKKLPAHMKGGDGYGRIPKCSPMIANLVTSPEYQRKGIGTSLINAAKRYVRCQWENGDCILRSQEVNSSLGLYVDSENSSAISLYSKQGFNFVCEEEEGTGLRYMRTLL